MPAPPRPPRFDSRRFHHWIAYGFGTGLVPHAPGTAGTLAAIPLYLLLRPLPLPGYLLALAAGFALGLWACDKTARELGARDPGAIVWDEVLGFLLAMTAAPPGALWVVLGFLVFRGFDIFKPWPIRALERRIQGGLGILLDDLLAGALTWGLLHMVAAGLG